VKSSIAMNEKIARISLKVSIFEANSWISVLFLAISLVPNTVNPRSLNRTAYAKIENAKLIFPNPEAPSTLARYMVTKKLKIHLIPLPRIIKKKFLTGLERNLSTATVRMIVL